MTILPGPIDNMYNSSKEGALLEEYTIYKLENNQIIKKTASRKYTGTDYIDSTTVIPLDIGKVNDS